MRRSKQDMISFKADRSLLEAMKGIENRSGFIRDAILAALDGACPLCMGTGILTTQQKAHWDAFAKTHSVVQCGHCNEMHLICDQDAPEGHAD